jgi:NAD(P)-dependent dehydrogenase (short-subunit alcohol dehydrogenase family)
MRILSRGWNTEEMPDQEGKVVVVTGANSGLGFEVSKKFAEKNAGVVMACRSVEKGLKAKEKILEEVSDATLEVMEIDLVSLDSVERFAEKFRDKFDRLDVLCNNAGIMAVPYGETENGFEKQFSVNHLGHFALTAHLIEILEETGNSRVVTQSSIAHENGEIDLENLNSEENYDRWEAYSRSKLANLLFAKELDRKLKENDWDVKSVACHPGVSNTNLFNAEESQHSYLSAKLMENGIKFLGQSPAKGALPMLYAAASPEIKGGEYIGPDGFKKMRGNPEKQKLSEKALDEELARKLWDKSEEHTGVNFEM